MGKQEMLRSVREMRKHCESSTVHRGMALAPIPAELRRPMEAYLEGRFQMWFELWIKPHLDAMETELSGRERSKR